VGGRPRPTGGAHASPGFRGASLRFARVWNGTGLAEKKMFFFNSFGWWGVGVGQIAVDEKWTGKCVVGCWEVFPQADTFLLCYCLILWTDGARARYGRSEQRVVGLVEYCT